MTRQVLFGHGNLSRGRGERSYSGVPSHGVIRLVGPRGRGYNRRHVTTTTAAPVAPSSPPTARQSHYLPTLDGWRAVAIGLVLLHHASYSIRDAVGPSGAAFGRFFYLYGGIGVHVFFALSGLLICTRLLQEHAGTGRVGLRAFYVRRAYRILPPMLTFLTAVGVLGIVGAVTMKLYQWISCLLLYANYRPGGTWTLGHFWTLSVEEHFYLTWPFLFALAGPRRALPATVGLAIAVGIWRALDMTYMLHSYSLTPPTLRTDTVIDGLLWGAAVALLLARPAVRGVLTRVLRPPTFFLLLAGLVAIHVYELPIPFAGPVMLVLRAVLLPLLLAATLLHPRSAVGRLLELRPVRWVGRLSYSLYLYQQIFLVWVGRESPMLGRLQSFPVNLACAFACAVASYYLIEKPLVREGYRVAARWHEREESTSSLA